MNAYRATGARRYLHDAERALRYIAAVGWDRSGGGHLVEHAATPTRPARRSPRARCWRRCSTSRPARASPSARPRTFLQWANTSGFSAADGLYAASNIEATPIDYIEAPLIYAQALLCRLTGAAGECERAEQLKRTALDRFGYLLDFSPQYDAIYLQWMLALYGARRRPGLYRLAADNARDAQTRALNGQGLYLLSWNGEALPGALRRAGDAPDAGRHHEPVRVAGGLPAAAA